jgi:hypothetical protein
MPKFKFFEFTVSGTGAFPTDMLRYDACYPTDETNILIAPYRENSEYYREKRSVNLRASYPPTIDRWKSFGWSVSNVNGRSY